MYPLYYRSLKYIYKNTRLKFKKKKKIVTAITKTSPAQPRTCQDPPTKNLKQILLRLQQQQHQQQQQQNMQQGPALLTNPK